MRPLGVFSARHAQTCHGPAAAPPSPRRSSGLASGLLAVCITVATFQDAVAQPVARETPGPTPEPPKPAGDGGAGKVAPKAWQWQLGVGIPLLALGVIMTGVGGAFLANPPTTDPLGCNVGGFAGPCVIGRASSGTLLGFGVAFGVGGAVLTGFGIRSAVLGGARSQGGETKIEVGTPAPASIPAASLESAE